MTPDDRDYEKDPLRPGEASPGEETPADERVSSAEPETTEAASTGSLSHLDEHGRARMVDVGSKATTRRRAVALARVAMRKETLDMIVEGRAPKGDVLATARIAAIMAAKKTSELIPLCHPIALTHVSVEIETERGAAGTDDLAEVTIRATCESAGQTGVEMEALTAVSVGGLTLYDMCKAVDRAMVVREIKLLEKSGGASGKWSRA